MLCPGPVKRNAQISALAASGWQKVLVVYLFIMLDGSAIYFYFAGVAAGFAGWEGACDNDHPQRKDSTPKIFRQLLPAVMKRDAMTRPLRHARNFCRLIQRSLVGDETSQAPGTKRHHAATTAFQRFGQYQLLGER
jgi:hypothetical protein